MQHFYTLSIFLTFVFFVYVFIVFFMKFMIFFLIKKDHFSSPLGFDSTLKIIYFISPDYWVACFFKEHIKAKGYGSKVLKSFVVKNNNANLIVSILTTLLVCFFFKISYQGYVFEAVCIFIFLRTISRGVEIAYAFFLDIVQDDGKFNSTGLKKHERIELAAKSYLEVFVLYTAVYLILSDTNSISEAIISSLSVGTLTNVGYVVNDKCSEIKAYIAYGQVIVSQSLVILSLAGYLSRNDNKIIE